MLSRKFKYLRMARFNLKCIRILNNEFYVDLRLLDLFDRMWTPLQLFKWSIASLRQTKADAYNCYLIERLLHMIYIFVICVFLSFCELHLSSVWLFTMKDVSIKQRVCRIWTILNANAIWQIQMSSHFISFKWRLVFAPSID